MTINQSESVLDVHKGHVLVCMTHKACIGGRQGHIWEYKGACSVCMACKGTERHIGVHKTIGGANGICKAHVGTCMVQIGV